LVDHAQSFIAVLTVAALAPILAGLVSSRLPKIVLPVVVVELVLGYAIGPQGFALASSDQLLHVFSELGLGFLFFFAGYEIRFDQIRGEPLKLATKGWLLSLVLAYSLAGLLHQTGVIISGLLVGTALATTAIGTLIPILRDEDRLSGDFGRQVLAIGAVGEFGPVLIVTVLLTASNGPFEQIELLVEFLALAVLTGIAATGFAGRFLGFVNARMENSGQLPVRLTVLLVFGLVALAGSFGMDVILGAFAAGIIMRLIVAERDAAVFDSKLEAVGFGLLIPFFFVVSGIDLDLASLFSSSHPILRLLTFFLLMLIVRGVPELLLYRRALPREELPSLALLASTQLPLVVAITTIGLEDGSMRPETAAALVSAAVLTVLVFPALSLLLLNRPSRRAAGTYTAGTRS
jgi:Kef-type K+ transport system membrane component KefB